MADIQKLLTMMQELDDQLVNCMRCGMCQAVCPLFKATGREADVARGKLALLDGLAHEMLSDPEGVNERLNRCLLCGTCQANCPSGVKVTDIFLKARAILTGYFGLAPAKKAIFRGLLKNPTLFNTLTDMGSKFQGLFTKKVDDLIGTSCARMDIPGLGEGRRFKTLADKPLHKTVPSMDTRGKNGRVAFYVGCAIDKIFPSVGEAAIKVLKHHDVGIYLPKGQACCGIPVISSGDQSTFNTLVRQNLDLYANGDFDAIITCCGSCSATMKEMWPHMYEGSEQDRMKLMMLADKVMDISQYLVDRLGVHLAQPKPGAKKVTYHDPCHLKNSQGITAQPREVLQANPAYTLQEMNEAGVCCGCGGSFNLAHYDLSTAIGTRKAKNVIDSGADIAATSCPACMLQLSDMLSRQNARIPVKHVIELYAESLDD